MARTALAMARDPLTLFAQTARAYGDVALLRGGIFDLYLLSHPDHVHELLVNRHRSVHKSRVLKEARRLLGEGLLTSEGELHRRQRRMIQPLFHRRRLQTWAGVMAERSAEAADRWVEGRPVDVHREMMRLTLDVTGRTLFGGDVGADTAARVAGAMEDALSVYNVFLLPFSTVLDRLPLPSVRRFNRGKRALDEIVLGVIDERRGMAGNGDGEREDLLALLMAARDEEASPDRVDGMDDRQIRDEAMTLFLAGHETTANALSWAWHLLATNPQAEAALHQEVDAVLGDGLPTADDLPRLPFARMCFAEALRLYPPSWSMGRTLLEDLEVSGYVIPAGSQATVSQWVIHRDPRWFRDPLLFLPQRHQPATAETRPRYSFFPFGAGPRMCMGEDFAWMEGILVLATIAARWRLVPVPGHPVAPAPRITLRPKHGIRMLPRHRRSTGP